MDLERIIDALSQPLGGVVLIFIARYIRDAAKALNERNAKLEKVEKDLNEAWVWIRRHQGSIEVLKPSSKEPNA